MQRLSACLAHHSSLALTCSLVSLSCVGRPSARAGADFEHVDPRCLERCPVVIVNRLGVELASMQTGNIFLTSELARSTRFDLINGQGIDNIGAKLAFNAALRATDCMESCAQAGQAWLQGLDSLVGDVAWKAHSPQLQQQLANVRGELLAHQTLADKLQLPPGFTLEEQCFLDVRQLSQKTLRRMIMDLLGSARQYRLEQLDSTPTGRFVRLDWTSVLGKKCRYKWMMTVTNTWGQVLGMTGGNSVKLEEYAPALAALSQRKHWTATVLFIGKHMRSACTFSTYAACSLIDHSARSLPTFPPSLPADNVPHGVADGAYITQLKEVTGVEHVLQDLFHVSAVLFRILNCTHDKYAHLKQLLRESVLVPVKEIKEAIEKRLMECARA